MCVEELKNTELDESTENSCKCSDTDEEVTVSEVAEEIVEEAAKSNKKTSTKTNAKTDTEINRRLETKPYGVPGCSVCFR